MRFAYSCIGLALLLAAGCARQESQVKPPPPASDPQSAATTALDTFRQLVNAQNYRTLGFESADEVKSATLGAPLPVYNIGLEQLKAFKPETDANSLLASSAETVYPVVAAGQVRSSVTVIKAEGGYKPASFGNAEIVKALSQYRGEGDSFVVRVPALSLYFIGRRADGKLTLTPIAEDPRIKARPGEALPAGEILGQLVSVANEYNGLPM
jgi:hypothetical protein